MIGQYILERREKMGVLQKDLAQKLNVSAQFLGRAEKGFISLPESTLKKCIILLDMSEAKLVKIHRIAGEHTAIDLFKRPKNSKKRVI